MKLDEVNSADLNKVLLAEDRGVVLDFWGTWCQPCRTLRPHLEGLADEFAESWRLVAVHVEENPEIVERYDVMTTPTLIFIRGGDEVHRLTGSATPSTIAGAMSAHA